MRRLAPALLSCLALLACSDDVVEFTPASYIERMRILGVRADPPEIAPGEETELTALVADPYAAGGRALTYVWLTCDPDATAPLGSACTRQGTAGSLDDIIENPPPGLNFIPIRHKITYTAPVNALDALAHDTLERERGVTATIMLVVIEGDFREIQNPDAIRQIAIKRVRIADRVADRNRNPSVGTLTIDGAPTIEGQRAPAKFGAGVELIATASEGSAETFRRRLPDGSFLDDQEQSLFSWFTTSGSYDSESSFGTRTESGKPLKLFLPAAGPDAVLEVFVVLRDARGGIDWARRRLELSP